MLRPCPVPARLPALALLLVWGLAGSVARAQNQEPLSLSTTFLDFGEVVMTTSRALSFTVTNITSSPVEIASLGVTPAGSAYEVDPQTDFNSPPIVLAGGESLVVEVTFSPTGVGFRSATVEVWDQFENLYTVSLFGTGVIEASPSSLAFGVVAVGSSAVRTLTLRNPSLELSVTVDNIYALGSSEETIEYTASPGGDFVLGPGESRDVSVTFAPTFPGTQNGDLYVSFSGNDSFASIRIPLSGEGAEARLAFSPGSLDFGEVAVGAQAGLVVTFQNEGASPVTILGLALDGSDAAAFQVSDTRTTLSPGESFPVEVVFAPESPGEKMAELVVTSDDPSGEHRVPLSGKGVVLVLNITPSVLDFGEVAVGDSATAEVVLSNEGEGTVELASIGVEGSGASAYAVGVSSLSLAPGASEALPVTFAPSSGQAYEAMLVLEGNVGRREVALSGAGLAPRLVFSPEALDFGEVAVGDSVRQELTLANEGGASLTVFEVTLTGDDAGAFTVGSVPATLSPGESFPVEVVFAPGRLGEQVAELEVTSDDPGGSSRVLLRGQGVPSFILSDNTLDFGEVVMTTSRALSFTVTNITSSPVEIASLGVTPAGSAYEVDPQTDFNSPPIVLAGGESLVVEVTFSPTGVGFRSATVEVWDQFENLYTVSLFGTGVIEASPSSLAFGVVAVGSSAVRTLTLRNPSLELSVTVDNIYALGSSEETIEYTASPGGDFVLGPGESRDVSVTFAPTFPGTQNGTLYVMFTGGEQSAGIAIPLEGEGGFGRLTLSPEALDFGEVAVGDSVRQELTLVNEGGASLTVFEVTLTGDDAGAFTVGSVPATLSPGESFPVEVVFAPGRLGEQVAELEVTSDDPGGSSRVLLRGQGVSSFILSDNALDFGAVRVGQTQRRTFTVTNRTAGPLVLALSLDDEAGFDLEGGVSFVLQDGEAREVAVSFAPAARGVQATTLRVQAPETEAPEQTVALRGQGVAPQMQVSADSLDFGTVVVGLSAGLPLELSNAGDDVLAVSELAIEGAGAAAFSLVEAGESFLLEPGAQRTLAVQFAPRSGGEQAAVLRIRSDDPEQPQRDVVLAGSGAAIQNESPVLGVVNTAVDVRFVLPPDFEPTTARLFYRVGGRRTYETTDLLPDANQYGGAIPAEAMTLRGVQYYAEFVWEDQVVTIPPQDPTGHPEQIRVQVDHVPAEVPASFLSLRPETYALVSVPLELADPGIPAVLADDYGTYDPARWRVLRWATASEAYAEFPGLEDGFSGGRAFWLITRDGQGFDVDNGLSTDLSGPFVIILPPGWSQIGNPFAFPVAVDDTEAGGVLEGPHAFDGQQYLPNRSVLQPWQGYFVFNPGAGPVTLSIPPVEAGEVAAKEVPLPWQAADFAVQLMAEVPRYGLRDTYNAVGFAGATMAGWGSLDLREPPGIGPHVQLSIVENGRRYLSRFVRAPESGAAWDLEVSATLPGSGAETVLVTLVEHGARPAGFVLYVLDRDEGQVLPAETGRFAVTLSPERPVRRLRLIMGTEDFAESRADGVSLAPSFSLEPNHPNPFNPTTLIRYSLGGESPVSLEVFNVLGERVRTLVDRHQRGGSYEVIWDGRDESGRPVASGVYVYRLRAGTFTASRTMVLLR